MLRRFFSWYGPWFVAYSQVLIRQQEFEADRSAVRAVGAAALASTLRRFAVKAISWDQHLAARVEQSNRRGLGGPTVLRRALADLSARHGNDQDLLNLTLSFEAQLDDTHPVLAQRLVALGESTVVRDPAGPTGASLLGSSAETFIALFGKELLQQGRRDARPASQTL
ncbi:M48 family metalloprotease [Sphingomonas bacterium]|uniref:M48 family metalloprotease n=1 Tax=Sphingomonas bacterium TaxID=1895847 RepID=UPI0015765E7E|nr:M48 family metalloprotease [Sphingomonas bacterium]